MTIADQDASGATPHQTALRRPGISDVVRGYQLFLGRGLENVAVAGVHIAKSPDFWDLVEGIWHSPEARHRRLAEALSAFRSMHDVVSTPAPPDPAQLDALFHATCDRWRKAGLGEHRKQLILNEPRFSERSVRSNLAQALERGRAEWDDLRRHLDRLGWQVALNPAVTVLGVEAHRLLGAGPEIASHLVAIELLEADVAKGRRAEQMTQASAAQLQHLAQTVTDLPPTDIFYSVAALQYAPPPVIVDLLRRCIRSVRDGGCAVFQVPASLHGYAFDIAAQIGSDTAPDFHCVAQTEILGLLADEGFSLMEVMPDERASIFGLSYTYFARKSLSRVPLELYAERKEPDAARHHMSERSDDDEAIALMTCDAEWIVRHLYQAVLDRGPDAEGLAHYANMIWDDTTGERTLTAMLIGSPEFRERAGAVDPDLREAAVEDCRVLVPSNATAYSPHDAWALPYFLETCEPGAAVLDLAPGSGVFALPAARRVQPSGRVYVVASSDGDCDLLVQNIARNQIGNVELLPASGTPGREADYRIDRLRPFMRKVDIVRLDAAGIASRSLHGAIEIIRGDRPMIFLEYAYERQERESAREAVRLLLLLAGIGYRFEILHREQPRQRVDASEPVATIEAALRVQADAGVKHLDLCARPAETGM